MLREVGTGRHTGRAIRRTLALLAAGGLAMGGATVTTAPRAVGVARATLPATVTADALPTVQINGVVWAQVTVGNIVYATGSFSRTRPAGARPGAAETPTGNLLAYSITTGRLITSFRHFLNAQGRAIAVSPDHRRLYVGGSFTRVDGRSRHRIAEFDLAAGGTLVPTFAPALNSTVRALAATNANVYLGGEFTAVGGTPRMRLAAFSRRGALLSWAPTADNNAVTAMVIAPGGRRVIVGGSFTSVDHALSRGLAAISPVTGRTVGWGMVGRIKNSGSQSAITSLSTNGKSIFGTGYVYGGDGTAAGKLEGAFSADPSSGAINFLEDCHGDTYDGFATGSVFYAVSHEHFCGNIGAFPETSPRTYHHATAFTNYATGRVLHNTLPGYTDWFGRPAPTQLNWYPTLANGTYTGQSQAAWSITGNDHYVVLGGEFPSVNGTPQQGLVRFAVSGLAPNKVGPAYSAHLTPAVASVVTGTAMVSWTQTADPDDAVLTYEVVRDSTTISATTVNDTFYTEKQMSLTVTGLMPGSRVTFRVTACDPFGNCTRSAGTSVTVAGNPPATTPPATPTPTPTATATPTATPSAKG